MAAMTSKILTIPQFLQLPNANLQGSKIQLCGKIVSEINGDTFCFADGETAIDCKIVGQHHLTSKYLKKDGYIKIIDYRLSKILASD